MSANLISSGTTARNKVNLRTPEVMTAVQEQVESHYRSDIVDQVRRNGGIISVGGVTVRLAKQFGFCYGVERAIDLAYAARKVFKDRRLFIVGEIIHNPHVNDRLRGMGIAIVPHSDPNNGFDFSGILAEDVVIMPAFGVTIDDFSALRAIGCILVDTTCGSVLNVWKRVESYARDGFTSVIHGKHYHEETKATASQVMKYPGGRNLVVFDMAEARMICDFIERGENVAALETQFSHAVSPGFDF